MKSGTYEDMSKRELITLVKRLTTQHDEWRELALRFSKSLYEEIMKED